MINESSINAKVVSGGEVSGTVISGKKINGTISVGAATLQKAVLTTPQDLTVEEVNQVHTNIRSAGRPTEGNTYIPYTIEEVTIDGVYDVLEHPTEPVVAENGGEIYNDYEHNIATGLYAIASGYKTQALGNYSTSEGWWTIASGQCSKAEGLLTTASGHFSHSEGTRTIASINNAHAEGDSTVASGRQSHAEGQGTVASGFCAHAEGSNTVASNYYAHAEGLGTIAAGRNQTAMGKYNVRDTSSLVIVGKGTKDSNRINAYLLDSSGNGWFSGNVYVGSKDGKTKDSGSKKLATEDFVSQKIEEAITITSPNGTRFKITVDDNGILTTTAIT